MIFRQFLRTETGCVSCLIGSGVKSAAVIDPNLEVERYLDEAKANDVAISHICWWGWVCRLHTRDRHQAN